VKKKFESENKEEHTIQVKKKAIKLQKLHVVKVNEVK